MFDIGLNKFLAALQRECFIVIDYEVTGKIKNPDSLFMWDPITVPQFDLDSFPFVILHGSDEINLINVKEKTIQVLVQAEDIYSGFFIELPGRGFDFHFASQAKEDDEMNYGYHHRLQCREDFIQVLKKCGRVPLLSLEDAITLIEKSKEMTEKMQEMERELAEIKTMNKK